MAAAGPSLRRARVVERYVLYDEIGAGGMASVYLGRLRGPVGFGRTVAVKCLHPQFAKDPEFVAMLLDEARLTSRIQHPNVVPTLDVVATEGELFVVMEYVRGETLSSLVRAATAGGERVPPAVAASIVYGVLQGLHAAHETKDAAGMPLGIVHRDVTPQNVLVGADGVPRVLDFGVAKALGQIHVTRRGDVKGKLAYMSPEQLSGRATRQSDVYAAGIILWEALTGERLFGGGTEVETVANAVSRVAEPPSAVRRGEAAVAALDAVVTGALERDPARRFATAREMAFALERSGPMAPPTEVAAWVERLAGPKLEAHARLVAEIERDAATIASAAVPASAAPAPVAAAAAAAVEEAQRAPTGRRLGGAIAAAVGFVVVLVVALALLLRGRERRARNDGASVAGPTPASLAPAAPVASISSASSVASIASPPAAPSTEAVDAATVTVVAPRRASSSGAAARARRCTPPFYLDASGRKVFKEECLR